MCRSKIPLIPVRKNQTRGKYQRPQGKGNSQLRVRQIQENLMEEDQEDQKETESLDPEATLYIKELTEDWADVNHIAPTTFKRVKNTALNENQPREIWIETTISNKNKIQWLANPGSPRSFIALEKANKIINNNPGTKLQPYMSQKTDV